jgi:hypothetical protein
MDYFYRVVSDGPGDAFSRYGGHVYTGDFFCCRDRLRDPQSLQPRPFQRVVAFSPGHFSESLTFIVILGIHTLVYAGLYYGVSVLFAKVVTLIKRRLIRNCIVAVFCIGLVLMTQFPIYGGGGHGPIRWHPLVKLLGDFNKSYGAGTVEIVYSAAILLFCGILLTRKL